MAWKEWQEGTTTEVLYGADLNGNFDYLSTILAAGITAGNLAAGCVGAGAVAADAIGESHMDWTDGANSPKVLQVGKATATYQQWFIKGTAAVASVTASNFVAVTVDFIGAGDCCTSGEPMFAKAPHVHPEIYTSDLNLMVKVSAVGTDTAMLVVYYTDTTSVVSTDQVIYWTAEGDVA